MAFAKPRADAQSGASGFDARARKLFLEHLALTSNVAASARKAGVASSRVYALKRKNPDFACDWQAALSEGFARLEAELLAEALRTISGKVSDATLKSRAQKHRLALALLAMHRNSVRGAPKPVAKADNSAEIAARVEAKLLDMRARVKAAMSPATVPVDGGRIVSETDRAAGPSYVGSNTAPCPPLSSCCPGSKGSDA